MALLDFVWTTRVRRHQEGKTNLDLLQQEIVSGSGISWATRKSALRPRHMTMPASHHSVFTGWMPFLLPNQQCQRTEGSGWEVVCCTEGKENEMALQWAEMKMVTWMCGVKLQDRIPSKGLRERHTWHNLGITAKQVVMVWACPAKRTMIGWRNVRSMKLRVLDQEVDQR